jgi:branched-chain amino acid transport system permease protein
MRDREHKQEHEHEQERNPAREREPARGREAPPEAARPGEGARRDGAGAPGVAPARRPGAPAPSPATRAAAPTRRWRAALPWGALLAVLVAPMLAGSDWAYACFAQIATMIVLALSYNLLLGETGLLSLGHAVYAGLGALAAARVFNQTGMPLPLLPLVGGVAGALCGLAFGAVSTRRAGTAFAMITLGIGELVSAASWTLPGWFGGEAGVAIDRTSGPALAGWTFGPAGEAYALIALWCALACGALFALSRTPLVRLANAVRDNPVRAAAIGCAPARIRLAVFAIAAGFAGVAGTLGLINVELVSTESVGMLRSASVLIATVIGGSGTFFGPVVGAIVLTFFSVVVASVTRAWLLYLGLLFVVVVIASPGGISGGFALQRERLVAYGWRRGGRAALCGALAALGWVAALVLLVQWLYAVRFGADAGERPLLAGMVPAGARGGVGCVTAAGVLACVGWVLQRRARRASRSLARERDARAHDADCDIPPLAARRPEWAPDANGSNCGPDLGPDPGPGPGAEAKR